MKKRMLSLFLAITMVLQLCGTMAFAVEADGIYASGEAGMLSWVVTDDGTLTISGSGGMDIYEEDAFMYSTAPWGWCAPKVEKIIIEEGVMSISPYAFAGFDKLRYAEIPDSVMMVDSYAFYRQSGEVPTILLFKGDAPDYIGSMAFAQRYNTYGVYMEGQSGWAEEIGDYYANINWLSMDEHGIIEEGTCGENHTWKIALDGTMTISGSGRLEGGFWTIAPYTKLVIEEGTTAIGDYAFCMLGNLTSVVIPSTVTAIGQQAFDECYNIADITFKGNAPAIHEFAFNYAGYYNGTTAYYPANNSTWTEEVRQNYGGDLTWEAIDMGGTEPPADNITWSLDDGTLTISGNGPMPDYTYDEETGRYNTPWHSLAWQIDHVVIGDGITSIGANTLSGMSGLEKLTIGASVEAIAENVFSSAWYLEEIIVSADNTHYGMKDGVLFADDGTELVFYPYSLEDTAYTIPDGVQKIAPYAFCWTSGDLTSVTIPEGVTTIGASAFSDLQLEELDLPESLKTIGSFAFYGCTLTEVTIPANVEFIGTAAFGYTWLEEVTFEGDAPTMECGPYEQIFEDVEATVYYPANNPTWTEEVLQNYGGDLTWTLADMGGTDPEPPMAGSCGDNLTWRMDGGTLILAGSGDMYDYHWLDNPTPWDLTLVQAVVFEEGCTITRIGNYAFNQCAGLTAIDIPDTVTSIGNNAFYGCTALAAVELPDSLQTIGETAFSMCAFTEVTIPAGVTYMDNMAFAYGSLTTVTMQGSEPELGDRVFGGAEITTYAPWITWSSDQWGTVIYNGIIPDTTAPVITEVWPATADKVTFCHDGTLQMAATDDTALDKAEFFADGIKIGEAAFNAQGIASLNWDCSALSGKVTLTYVAYDKAGNTAETTAEVTVRPYTRPVTPADLTAESGFRSGVLTWTYDGDLQTLRQFNIYDGDPDGGMLITSVRGYQYAIRDLEEPVSYKVAAVDIYGNQSLSTEAVTVTPVLTENVPPRAVLAAQELTAVTGTPITLTGSNSTDNDAIASYTWDFGDGTAAEGVYATHTYTAGGTYTVVLTVTDRSGNSDTVRAEITVLDTLSEDATHTRLTVTVRNSYAAGTPGIAGATVSVFSDGYEGAALTDSRGTATLVVPKGQHTLTVVRDGFDGKMQEISIGTNIGGETALTLHLAPSGVDIVGGELKVEPMTREEIEEAGIDMSDPANNHVVKQSTTVRFQPTPELAFELPIEQIINAAGKLLDGKGFGWHTFTPDPPKPDDPDPDEPEEDDDDDKIIVGMQDPIPPKYDVGVFPVGDSAFMVIYGQTHWLKEMFNVELIVFNNSYVDDLEEVSAQLHLPKGLSLAAMLEGDQTEKVDLGTIERKGTAEDTSVRQVNWYVRGDAEGEYNLTALVSGTVGGAPFEKTFTAEEAIKVYAGSALKLTVTLPKSAYAEKEYAVKFSLTNVSDKPIYNLSFGLDSAQQFVAERMSDGSTGEVERVFTSEDFKNNMTYGLPTLEPGKAFNLILRTTFAYEHQFIEWAMGKVPGTEVGYRVADIFVTTLEGSTTEIPVEIVLEDVKKDSLFQWVWDETIGALKDNAKDAIIEFVDDKVFQGIPVVEKGVEIIEVVTNVKDELTDPEIEYKPTVNVTDGVQCVPKNEVDDWLSAFDTYSLRRSALPGVILWTDAEDVLISEDGKTMTLPSGGRLYVLRLGETETTPEIDITTYYVDIDGTVQPFTQKLTAEESYTGGLGTAKHILLDNLTESTFEIPTGEEIVEVGFDGWLIGEKGEILRRASNENWRVEGEKTTGLTIADGKLMVDSTAYAGTYTVRLTLDGTEEVFEQTITLTGGRGVPPFGRMALTTLVGDPLDVLPKDEFLVKIESAVDLTNAEVFVAAYSATGKCMQIEQAAVDADGIGTARLNNIHGRLAELCAFALSKDGEMLPLGGAAELR